MTPMSQTEIDLRAELAELEGSYEILKQEKIRAERSANEAHRARVNVEAEVAQLRAEAHSFMEDARFAAEVQLRLVDEYGLLRKQFDTLLKAAEDAHHALSMPVGVARVRLKDTDFDARFGNKAVAAFDIFSKSIGEAQRVVPLTPQGRPAGAPESGVELVIRTTVAREAGRLARALRVAPCSRERRCLEHETDADEMCSRCKALHEFGKTYGEVFTLHQIREVARRSFEDMVQHIGVARTRSDVDAVHKRIIDEVSKL